MKQQQGQQTNIRNISVLILLLFILGFIASCWTNNVQASARHKSTPSSIASSSKRATTKYIIMIDAGHGGKDPGATGANGMKEKEYTLSLSKKVYKLLKREPMFEPHMTRIDDSYIAPLERVKLANNLNANAFISIHANFSNDPKVIGTETYYYFDNSIKIAQVIHQHVVKAMGFRDRGVRKSKLKVLSHSKMTATLIELGYITNKKQEAAMVSNYGQSHAAKAIVDGLKQYFTKQRHIQMK